MPSPLGQIIESATCGGKRKREKVMSLIVGMKQVIRQLRAVAWAVGAVGAAGLMAAAPAQATMSNCTAGGGSWSNWTPNPLARPLNGQVLSTATATLRLVFRVDSAFSFGAWEEYRTAGEHGNILTTADFNRTYMASPVRGSRDIAVRVRYGGTNTIRTTMEVRGATVDVDVPRITPAGEINMRPTPHYLGPGPTSPIQMFTRFVFGPEHHNVTFTVDQTWHYELVLVDEKNYKGALVPNTAQHQLIGGAARTSDPYPSNSTCQLISNNFSAFRAGGPPNPPLPPVLQPACSFSDATLRQTVSLGSARPFDVAADNAPRSAGAVGQVDFSIRATDCGKGGALRIYFTDTSTPANRSQILGLPATAVNRNRLGIRLYHDRSTVALDLGPVPTVTDPGTHFTAVPIPREGGSFSVPFTAQYVRYPDVAQSQIQPGNVTAQATLTIIHQ